MISQRGSHWDRRQIGISFLLFVGVVLIVFFWVDRPVALLIAKNLPGVIASRREYAPDLLLPLTLVISATSWAGYIWLTSKKSDSPFRHIFATIGLAALLALASKTVLQRLFGRLNPVDWLTAQHVPRFHLPPARKNSYAFPSGHMTVFTAVLISLGRMIPSLGALWIGLWAALAIALVGCNFHFVSDIVAGAYLGIVIDWVSFKSTLRLVDSSRPPDSACR